jgi:hypothetical protein
VISGEDARLERGNRFSRSMTCGGSKSAATKGDLSRCIVPSTRFPPFRADFGILTSSPKDQSNHCFLHFLSTIWFTTNYKLVLLLFQQLIASFSLSLSLPSSSLRSLHTEISTVAIVLLHSISQFRVSIKVWWNRWFVWFLIDIPTICSTFCSVSRASCGCVIGFSVQRDKS